jgi:hypothetical protein
MPARNRILSVLGMLGLAPNDLHVPFILLGGACSQNSNRSCAPHFLGGFLMIWINYDSDNQRYVFRQTDGNCTIFGKVPKRIEAKYSTKEGEERTSLLLLDGYWKSFSSSSLRP